MVRYFLHLRDGTDELLDPDGREFASMEALAIYATLSARDLLAGELQKDGTLDLRQRLDAEDEAGQIVYTLQFKDAVTIKASA